MKIEVTTAEMLAVCHTHIAIADSMSLMDLSTHQSIQGKGKSQTEYEEPQADQLQRWGIPRSIWRNWKFPGIYHIYLKEDVILVVHTPQKCPIAIWPLVDKKLDKLLE